MAKTILSPLFLGLLFLLIYLIYSYFHSYSEAYWRKKSKFKKYLTLIMILITISIWLLSTPNIAVNIAGILEKPYTDFDYDIHVDVVTVLSGGIFRGPVSEMDLLAESTQARVMRGIRTYKNTDSEILVMQGSLSGSQPERMTELMKQLALEMGVNEDDIITEPNSRNTFQHPLELLKIEGISQTDRLGVVTSAWHLKRAEREFEKHFEEIKPVPAEFYSYDIEEGFQYWLPQISGLEKSTKIIHEVIGMIYYQIK